MVIDEESEDETMMSTNNVGKGITRIIIRLIGIALMVVIGAVQAVGTILTAMSAVILKGISVLMIFVTVLLLVFGLFTWMKTLVVLLIAGSMFWVPEGMAAVVLGLTFVQGKIRDYIDVA